MSKFKDGQKLGGEKAKKGMLLLAFLVTSVDNYTSRTCAPSENTEQPAHKRLTQYFCGQTFLVLMQNVCGCAIYEQKHTLKLPFFSLFF